MGLGALPGLFRRGLLEFKRLGLLVDLRDGECAKDHQGLPVPDRKSKRWRRQLAVDSEQLCGEHLLLPRSRPDTHLDLFFRCFYGALGPKSVTKQDKDSTLFEKKEQICKYGGYVGIF